MEKTGFHSHKVHQKEPRDAAAQINSNVSRKYIKMSSFQIFGLKIFVCSNTSKKKKTKYIFRF